MDSSNEYELVMVKKIDCWLEVLIEGGRIFVAPVEIQHCFCLFFKDTHHEDELVKLYIFFVSYNLTKLTN